MVVGLPERREAPILTMMTYVSPARPLAVAAGRNGLETKAESCIAPSRNCFRLNMCMRHRSQAALAFGRLTPRAIQAVRKPRGCLSNLAALPA